MNSLVDLPDEILLEILEYFRIDDIKNVRLTCKRLYLLSLDTNITKRECLLLNERIFKRSGASIVAALMTSQRDFNILVFKNDNYYFEALLPEHYLVNVIAKFGANVKEVFYHKTNLEFSRTFVNVIEYCPNLESISIKDCNDLFMQESFRFSDARLVKMKTLKIYETQYLSDLILYRLITLCPNLEEITLSSCGMNMHSGVYDKFYREDPSDSMVPSCDVFNFKYFLHLIRGVTLLTDLNLGFSNITHKNVTQIMQLPNVKLRKLNLLGCREITWSKLLANNIFSDAHQFITHLNLSHSILVNDTVLLYISDKLIHIEVLYLANCFALTDRGFEKIQNLKKLRDLNVNNDHELTGDILVKLRACNLRSLKALHTNITNDQIIGNMGELKLTRCAIGSILKETLFSDNAIKHINKKQQLLRELHVHSLTVTNRAFIGEAVEDFDANLEALFMNSLETNLENYKFHENIESFRRIFRVENIPSEFSISNLRYLQVLNLDCCQYITDQIFKYSMDLPSLRKLSMSSTKMTFLGVCYLVQKCPNLECLDLENTYVNDAAVCILVQALPKLIKLSLKSCSKITSLSYKFVAKHCHKLKALHGWNALSHDDVYDEHSILTEIFNLPNISKLYASRCMLIQDDNVKLLPYANHPFYEHIIYD